VHKLNRSIIMSEQYPTTSPSEEEVGQSRYPTTTENTYEASPNEEAPRIELAKVKEELEVERHESRKLKKGFQAIAATLAAVGILGGVGVAVAEKERYKFGHKEYYSGYDEGHNVGYWEGYHAAVENDPHKFGESKKFTDRHTDPDDTGNGGDSGVYQGTTTTTRPRSGSTTTTTLPGNNRDAYYATTTERRNDEDASNIAAQAAIDAATANMTTRPAVVGEDF
jgi:hypothetical protein